MKRGYYFDIITSFFITTSQLNPIYKVSLKRHDKYFKHML